MHEDDIDTLVARALATMERRRREVQTAEHYLNQAEHDYQLMRERQKKEKPTLADLIERDARRPVRSY